MSPADTDNDTGLRDLPIFTYPLDDAINEANVVTGDLLAYLRDVVADYDAVDAFLIAGDLIDGFRVAAKHMANLRRAAAREGRTNPGFARFSELTATPVTTLQRLAGDRNTYPPKP